MINLDRNKLLNQITYLSIFKINKMPKTMNGPPRGLGDLGRMAIYFQGAGEHWLLFSGIW